MNEPTNLEQIANYSEHMSIELDYVRKQLNIAERMTSPTAILDCLQRAQDALERVADANGSVQKLSTEWTPEDIQAHAG